MFPQVPRSPSHAVPECVVLMKSLAVIVSRGSTNNLIQVLTLLMASVHAELRVRVFFRDESIFRLTPVGINTLELSEVYAKSRDGIHQRLQKLDLVDLL